MIKMELHIRKRVADKEGLALVKLNKNTGLKDGYDVDYIREVGQSDGGGFQPVNWYWHNIDAWDYLPTNNVKEENKL